MKKSTIEFVIWLLEKELDSEYINDNKNINEIDYVKDLINASQDFSKKYGNIADILNINEKINLLENGGVENA